MKLQLVRVTSALLVCSWIAMIYFLSSQSSVDIGIDFAMKDKLFHMAAYGLLGLFIMGTMRPSEIGYSYNQVALTTLIATIYGITDEWHQAYVPNRNSDPMDIIADCIGALLVTLAARAFINRRLRRQVHSQRE